MKATNITSSFSNREKMRRKPLSRRNRRSISLRRLVHLAVVLPGCDPIRLRRHDRDETQVQCQLPGLFALVGTIHQQMNRPTGLAQPVQERATLGRIVRLAGREREGDGGSSIRGNQMNLGCPSAAGLSNGLRAVFLAPRSHRDEPSPWCCPRTPPRS